MTSYFDALGLNRTTAQFADVKPAYREIIRTLHPDVSPDDEGKAKLVNAAYQSLSDAERFRQAKVGIFDRGHTSWKRQWEEMNGPSKSGSPRNAAADDLEEMIRNMERMRREARRNSAPRFTCSTCGMSNGRHDEFKHDAAKRAEREANERAERQRNSQKAKAESSSRSADGKCGAYTASGPCCRPAGHTPNGHMSQQVADTKRENAKRKRQQAKGDRMF